MTRFIARHPLLSGCLLMLLQVPALAVAMVLYARFAPVRLLLWAGMRPVYRPAAVVHHWVALVSVCLAVALVAMLRRRSGASMVPVVLLILIAPLQVFAQTTVGGALVYAYVAGADPFWSLIVGVLDDRDLMRLAAEGMPWAAAGDDAQVRQRIGAEGRAVVIDGVRLDGRGNGTMVVVDARDLGAGLRFEEIWNGYGGQDCDNGHYNQ